MNLLKLSNSVILVEIEIIMLYTLDYFLHFVLRLEDRKRLTDLTICRYTLCAATRT